MVDKNIYYNYIQLSSIDSVWSVSKLEKKFSNIYKLYEFNITSNELKENTLQQKYGIIYYYLSPKYKKPKMAFLDNKQTVNFVLYDNYFPYSELDTLYIGTYEQCYEWIKELNSNNLIISSDIPVNDINYFHELLDRIYKSRQKEFLAQKTKVMSDLFMRIKDGGSFMFVVKGSWQIMFLEEGKLIENILRINMARNKCVTLILENKIISDVFINSCEQDTFTCSNIDMEMGRYRNVFGIEIDRYKLRTIYTLHYEQVKDIKWNTNIFSTEPTPKI